MPKPKRIPILVPEFITHSVRDMIGREYQGRLYDNKPKMCPYCGSVEHVRHDSQKRLFCRLITDDGNFENVYVYLKRYKCKTCGRYFLSDGPFYDGIFLGKQIVDLILYLLPEHSSYFVEKLLLSFGIQTDRDSVLVYCRKFGGRAKQTAGVSFVNVPVGINLLQILFGVKNAEELSKKLGSGLLYSVMDETYPAKKGAKKKFQDAKKEAKINGTTTPKYPDSFTLACAYLPQLRAFGALICNEADFNWLMAKVLWKVMEGCVYNLTDGDPSYNAVKNRERCTVHKSRNMNKQDPILHQMKEDKKTLSEIKEYLGQKYEKFLNETIEEMKKKYPQLVNDKNEFTGGVNTNQIEGGNWRMKDGIRRDYKRIDSVTGKATLAAIKDSVFTMKCGKPLESAANQYGYFSYSNIMAAAQSPQVSNENGINLSSEDLEVWHADAATELADAIFM